MIFRLAIKVKGSTVYGFYDSIPKLEIMLNAISLEGPVSIDNIMYDVKELSGYFTQHGFELTPVELFHFESLEVVQFPLNPDMLNLRDEVDRK